ncbi:ATP-binding protein [Mangrovicoccus sp. HB161399]|uniref:ATP-binding protein n=1 Tax=Mangrovicoccus sp. HB161399 TaxID=2720392 RepID=UPI001556FF87|nr:ATP-binding protein [Mangrovicoccus sp. HB161399]
MPDGRPASNPATAAYCAAAMAALGRLLPDRQGSSAEDRYLLGLLARHGDPMAPFRAAPDPGDPLGALAEALALPPDQLAAAALALAVETDAMAGRAVARLQAPVGGARPMLGLAANAFGALGATVPGLASGAAAGHGLLRLSGTGPLPEQMLVLAPGLAAALTGTGRSWQGLRPVPAAVGAPWPDSLRAQVLARAEGLALRPATLLVLRHLDGIERDWILWTLGRALGRIPMLADPKTAERAGLGAFAAAAGVLPVFAADAGPGEHVQLPPLPGYPGPVIALAGPEGSTGCEGMALAEWEVPLPAAAERAALWRTAFPPEAAERLGRTHLQRAGRILTLCRTARVEAAFGGRDGPEQGDLAAALWTSEGEGIGAYAQPVRDRVEAGQLILPAALQGELELLRGRCARRETLADGLGTTMAARYKHGIRALFTGPSGTGKTMAASWLATRLELPLYRVDLSMVTSKYIGETEKNLSQLLARAEREEVVLLFDEADSMFGKRTDIQDSNDRFANAQTNYLLQRIETYTGIVLMTSNARTRFDSAFTRRIDAIVDFGQPDPAERRALWRLHLGTGHAVADADLNRLAALADLAGGHIRNVVLAAAVAAAEEDAPLAMRHLAAGLRSEYRKLGQTPPAELLRLGGKDR